MRKGLRPGRREGEGQPGLAVVVAYLGHGELDGWPRWPRLGGDGPALLAVHEREWCEGKRWW